MFINKEICDQEWIVVDPVLGDLSCDDEEHAVMTARSLTQIRVDYWFNGEVILRETYQEYSMG